jgi:hypothetical protein
MMMIAGTPQPMNTKKVMTLRFLFIALSTIFLWSCTSTPKIRYADGLSDHLEYDVILMGGQSNMVGQGKLTDLEPMSFSNVTFFDLGLNPSLTPPQGNFGPEVGLSMELSKNYPNKRFLLIKYAIGGASLLDWSPNYDQQKAEITGHPEFGNMYKKLIMLTDSLTKGHQVKVRALLWMQGERDARIPEAGVNYYNNFELLINSIRKDLKSPDLPVIFGKVNPPPDRYPALDTVVGAQMRISQELPNTYLIDTDDLEKWEDDLHYSSNGQIDLGVKFGEKLTEHIK